MGAYNVYGCNEPEELAGYTDTPVVWLGCWPLKIEAEAAADSFRDQYQTITVEYAEYEISLTE